MSCHHRGPWTRFGRAAAALLSALSLALEGTPAFSQRRQAEPEVNPDFQQTQSKPEGAPVGDSGAAAAAEPSAGAPDSSAGGGDDKLIESRSVSSVQIGAAPAARMASAAPTSALDTRVTVRVKGAPLATFLDTISAQAKINFIITEGLEQRRVTAFLQNVTVRDALQVLLEIKGLTYSEIGKSNTYVVTPRSKQAENLITRIYTLSFIPLIPLSPEDASATTSAAFTQSGSQPTIASPAAGGGAAASAGSGGKACSRGSQNISVMRIICSVLSKEGNIEVEPRTNALIVTDIPEVFPQVEQIIAELDKKAPQVMIEAQIVEIDSTRTRNLGFEWGGPNGELGTFTGGERDTTFPLNLSNNLGGTHFFDPLVPGSAGVISSLQGAAASASSSNSSSSSGPPPAGSYLKTSVLDLSQLQITLRALVDRSEGRFLGKPKILTLNNKTATIEIAQNQAVAIQSGIAGGNGTSQQTTSAERYETGVVLKVTPQVNKEGYITMLLQPSYTNVVASAISSAANPSFDPVKRTAITMVRIKNGQTLVLGGLLSSVENKDVRKVPFLGYIPLIGWLFTSDTNQRTNTDLVIFITPTIVSD